MSVYVSKALREVYPEIVTIFEKYIPIKEIDSPNLWPRDYMPIKIRDRFFKFHYKGYDGFPQLFVSEDCWKSFNAKLSWIVLDGGNVVQDNDTVFMTEQVFKNNSKILKNDLKRFLSDIFDKKIIYIPVEFGDDLGHADGIIKFIDKKTVFINDYRSWVNQNWYEYAIRLEDVLKKNGFDFVRFPWALKKCPIMTEKEFRQAYPYGDDFNPGYGYYINYYQTDKFLFVPHFDLMEDRLSMEILMDRFHKHEIVPLDCTHISMLGGLINCITWED